MDAIYVHAKGKGYFTLYTVLKYLETKRFNTFSASMDITLLTSEIDNNTTIILDQITNIL